MKKQNALLMMTLFALMTSITAYGQTYQSNWSVPVNSQHILCFMDDGDELLTGSMDYHAIFHVDKKTGYLKSIHFNTKKADLVGESGAKYQVVDIGLDQLDIYWDWMELPEGVVQPPVTPLEGTFIGNYLIIKQGSGVIYKGKMNLQFRIDSNGDLKVIKALWDFCI